MLNYKFVAVCLTLIRLNYFVWCDDYKNSNFPPKSEELHRELTKNQFDHVQIVQENIPRITKNLFWELGAVKKLEIKSCQVRTIEEGAFSGLKVMKKLSLKHNLLEEIKNGIFSNLEIEELDLSDNQIKVIEEKAFDYMYKLRSIKLKNNKIEVYNNKWFVHVPNLCSINFENNLIKALPSEVVGNKYYRGCPVDVSFSHNLIEKIDEEAFNGGFSLNRLYLDHNAIATLPKNIFFYTQRIRYLSLANNNIVCTTPRSMETVGDYNVDYNPWNPECLKAFEEGRDFPVDTTTTPTTTTTTAPTTTELPTKRSTVRAIPKTRYIRFG